MPNSRAEQTADAVSAPPQPHAALHCPDGLVIRRGPGGESLAAGRPFEAGEPVFQLLRVTWRAEADSRTVAHPSGRHLFDPVLARAAHARDPNCRVSAELMAVIARRDIAEGERITIRTADAPH